MTEPTIGHASTTTGDSQRQLKSLIERIERLDEEKKTLTDDIRDVYAEAKGTGFDVKALRTIIRLRKQDAAKRAEHEAIVDTYKHALGMLADLPLGQAAITRVHLPRPSTADRPFAPQD